MAFLSKIVTVVLSLASFTFAAPYSAETREGSVPSIQGAPALIDTNGVYIRASRMTDGSLIAGYTQNTGSQVILLTAKSTDNGASWSHLGEVFRGDTATHDCDNAFPMQLPNGRILYAYRNHDKANGANMYFRISLSYSDDGGVTFQYLSSVDERVANGANGLWEPYMRIALDGSIQCYYSSENNADDQDGHMKVSTDGGSTWSDIHIVSGADNLSRDGMIGCAPIDNGPNQMCVFEATDNSFFVVDSVTSSDDGLTWGNRQRRYTARGNSPQYTAGSPQIYNVYGTLVLSFMTNEDHDIGTGYDGGDQKVIISTDGGATWSESYIVGPSPAHWGGLVNIDENSFLALFARDGEGALSQLVRLD